MGPGDDAQMIRVTMLSMPCDEPVPALAALLAAPGCEVVSLVLAGVGEPDSPIARLAREAGTPVIHAASYREAREAVHGDEQDVAVAACFPWRLRRDMLDLPRLGVVNIHPSLLPSGRGPEPVFWAFRNGLRETGVTVHRMDEGLDTGPILAQRRVAIPDAATAPSLERELMGIGGDLAAALLPRLAAGEALGMPQDHAAATVAPSPAAADWLMPSTLPAGWAWRFARAVAPMGGPLAAVAGGRVMPVGSPVAMDDLQRLPDAVTVHDDGTVTVRFSPGWVRFVARDEA